MLITKNYNRAVNCNLTETSLHIVVHVSYIHMLSSLI